MRNIFSAILISGLALAAVAQEPVPFTWTAEIEPGKLVEIRGINGGIRAEQATGSQVEIIAKKTARRSDPNEVRIDVVPYEDGVLVCAIYPGWPYPNTCSPYPQTGVSTSIRNNDVQVEFTVRVPAGVGFKGRTINGAVDANLPNSPIEAETVNGRIALTTSESAQGSTVNGSVVVSLSRIAWTGTREFRTVNGAVDLELPEAVDATLRGSTVHGTIVTELPLTVHKGIVGATLSGDLGRGGPRLELSTVNGSLHVRQIKND